MVRGWLTESGLAVREDAVGNLFGRLEGKDPSPVILVGSHIDSVHGGGRLDGVLGVAGAIAAVRALKRRVPQPTRTVEVFVSCEEEGSRFPCDFWGARALVGPLTPNEADQMVDAEGRSMGDAMRAFGLDPRRAPEAARTDIGAMLELHIEQGPVLDHEGTDIGVVEAISGVNRTRITVHGRADHAGSTPMNARADALLASAEMVVAMRALAKASDAEAKATVGALTVLPNQPNIVASRVEFIVDSRHPVRARQEQLRDEVGQLCQHIGTQHRLQVDVEVVMDQPPTTMEPILVAAAEQAIQARGWSYRRLVSGPGHDTQLLGRHVPAVMLFVPSRDGRSHSPAEMTPPEQVAPGVQILADLLERLAV